MLRGKFLWIKELTKEDIKSMYELMLIYYENIKEENFRTDLRKKQGAILLINPQDESIKGFTTIGIYNAEINKTKIKLLFSGDTVIHQDFWSNNDLMQIWIKNAIKIKERYKEKLYWLLISKGYKTYKYLSTFYKEFYPRYDKKTPEFEKSIIDNFGRTYYRENYDEKKGIIVMNYSRDYLKKDYTKIPQEKLKDKNTEFFIQKNPEYYKGNELVCVTEIALENLNKKGRKIFGI